MDAVPEVTNDSNNEERLMVFGNYPRFGLALNNKRYPKYIQCMYTQGLALPARGSSVIGKIIFIHNIAGPTSWLDIKVTPSTGI